MLKKSILFLTILTCIICKNLLPASAKSTDTVPGKPQISVSITGESDEDCLVTLIIGKTANADGFEIYEKTAETGKYKKIHTLKKSGEKERKYEVLCTQNGKISFKVRAYNDSAYSKYSKAASVKVSLKSQVTEETKTETKNYTYKDISLNVPVSWGTGSTEQNMLYFSIGSSYFMLYSGDLKNTELTSKKAKRLVTEEYAAVCKSLDITNSDTYEYKNKKISKYYVYNVDTVMAQYYYEPTGRFGPNGMVTIKKEHTTDYKARITIIDYKGRYYVAVMCVLEDNYNKNSFKEYKEVIKSIKPNT